MTQLKASDLLCQRNVAPDLHYLGSTLSAAAVGLCNMMLHMFHMTNYTTQKEEGGGSIRVRRKGGRGEVGWGWGLDKFWEMRMRKRVMK